METFNLDILMQNEQEYEKTRGELKNLILNDFKSRHDKGIIIVNGEEIEMSKGKILLNLYLLAPVRQCGIKLCKEAIFTKDSITGGDVERYMNAILSQVKDAGISFETYRRSIYNFMNDANDLSAYVNRIAGSTIDYLDFLEAAIEDPEFEKLISAPNIDNMQFSEIEDDFKKRSEDLFDYFNNHPERCLSAFTSSNTGINKKQFVQTIGYVGLKPDFDGKPIPKVVTSNFLKGQETLEDFYISACGARLALSTNYNYVRKSGYFTRKLNLLMADKYHDNNYIDCGTKHYVELKLSDPRYLKLYDGRNYYDIINGKADYDNLKTLHSTDVFMLGKTIALRSPITCKGNSTKTGCICATCYGRTLSEINKKVHTGLVAVLMITRVLTQRLLSAKHLLATNTDEVDWGKDFRNSFIVNLDEIYFSDENPVELTIEYPSEELHDEDDDTYEITNFDIKFIDDKKVVHYECPTSLYIRAKDIPERKENATCFKINSEQFGRENKIFFYEPHNNMLTKSLENILDLIESKDHLGVTTYNELVKKFADLLIENDMSSINSIHAEMICSQLVNDAVTGKCLNWDEDILKPYKINRVSRVIMNAPISSSLSFERLTEQLSNLDTYSKDDVSIMDCLFN